MNRGSSQVELAKHPGALKGGFYAPPQVEEDVLGGPSDVTTYREKLNGITSNLEGSFEDREEQERKKRSFAREARKARQILDNATENRRILDARPAFRAHDKCLRSLSVPIIDSSPSRPLKSDYKLPTGDWSQSQVVPDFEGPLSPIMQKNRDIVERNVTKWRAQDGRAASHATTGYLRKKAMEKRLEEHEPFSALVRSKPHWGAVKRDLKMFHPDVRPISITEPYVHDYDQYITAPKKALDFKCGVLIGPVTTWTRPRKTLASNVEKAEQLFVRPSPSPSPSPTRKKERKMQPCQMEVNSEITDIRSEVVLLD